MEKDLSVFLDCGIAFAFVALLVWLLLLWNDKRTRAITQLALDMGYKFEVREPYLFEKVQKSGFDLFRRGHSRLMRNLLYGPYRDSTMMVFDYRYITGHGRYGRRQHWQTVVLFSWEQLRLPEFTLRPRGTLDALAAKVVSHGIDFEECPAFSRHYLLVGWSEEAVRQMFRSTVAKVYEHRPRLVVESSVSSLVKSYQAKSHKVVSVKSLHIIISRQVD